MDTHGNENPVAQAIAQAMIEGFNKHYRIFRETSRHAKESFEAADWQDQLSAVRNRVQFYDDRVNETVQRLHEEFDAESIDDATWQAVKLHYIGLLLNHKQPELAETFFNSVTTKILHRTYFHNDFMFVRPAVSTEYIESDGEPTYRCYYAHEEGLRGTIKQIFLDFAWKRTFADLDRDANAIHDAIGRFREKQVALVFPRIDTSKNKNVRREGVPVEIAVADQPALLGVHGWVGSLSVHVFTFGAMGLIIPAMMVRISLGHTGRKVAFDGVDRLVVHIMLLAFVVRVVLPQWFPGAYVHWVHLAAVAWSLAFAVLGFRLTPRLLAPRVDGREH